MISEPRSSGMVLLQAHRLAWPTHVEEVFPGFRFKIFLLLFIHGCEGLVQGGLGVHIDGTTAIAHFLDHHVVAQTGRG